MSNKFEKQFNQTFLDEHQKEISRLNSTEKQIFDYVISAEYIYANSAFNALNIKEQRIESLSDFVRKNYGKVVSILVPEEFTDDFYNACDDMTCYQYSHSSYRRSYRCKDGFPLLSRMFYLMNNYYLLRMLDVHIGSMKAFFSGNYEQMDLRWIYSDISMFANIVAERINAGDAEIIELIKDMTTSENNTNVLSYKIIKAVIMSKNSELHDLLCKLLVAARLSEGLRQAICECADCGTAEAFIKILNTIKENNLLRFPAIKRAIGTWTGICSEGDPDRLSQKLLDDIVYVLQSRENCIDYINTTDAVHIYSGLWGLSFYDIDDAVSVICSLVGIKKQTNAVSALFEKLVGKDAPVITANSVQLLTIGCFCLNIEVDSAIKTITNVLLEAFPEDYKLFSLFKSHYSCCKEDDRFVVELHYSIFMNMLGILPQKKVVFEQLLFPWFSSEISKSDIMECMLDIAIALDDDDKFEWLGEHLTDFDTYSRNHAVEEIGKRLRTEKQRSIVINALADKESYTRGKALKALENIKLTDDEYRIIEGFAKYKTADLRENVISLLKKRTADGLKISSSRMIDSKNENVRLAALDILMFAVSEYESEDFSTEIELASGIASPSDREQILINELSSIKDKAKLSEENGFGIYDPASEIKPVDMQPDPKIVSRFFSVSKDEITEINLALLKIVDENANLEYKNYAGEEKLLGNMGSLPYLWSRDREERANQKLYEIIPFHELWEKYYIDTIRTPQRFWAAYFSFMNTSPSAFENLTINAQNIYQKNQQLLFGETAAYNSEKELYPHDERLQQGAFFGLRRDVFECMKSRFDPEIPLDVLQNAVLYIIRCLPDDELLLERDTTSGTVYYWNTRPYEYLTSPLISRVVSQLVNALNDDFDTNFRIFHELHLRYRDLIKKCEEKDIRLFSSKRIDEIDYVIAYMKGIITADDVYKAFFEVYGLASVFSDLGRSVSRSVYNSQEKEFYNTILADESKTLDEDGCIPNDSQLYKTADMFISKLTDTVLDVELKRGDSETVFSKSIISIPAIYGAERLIEILKAMGGESFKTSYYGGNSSKKECLSHLLSVCMPKRDDADKFADLVKNTDISGSRLIETAMFAPQWIDIIEKYLGIDGFKLGCYYFMAHTAEYIPEKRFAVIAKYTPFNSEELRGGCFDAKWFREAYDILGEKTFNKIYQSAKYISSSNMHTRARKFSDAALGKMDIAETERTIDDKRNKDLLLSLAVIPSSGKADILQRYEFIQKFLKESRQFGAQRRASEAAAVNYALKNLAVTAGYSDETRLTLSMETELVKTNSRYFKRNEIKGYSVWIETDESGNSSLKFEKAGKLLKSAPAAIKKDENFIEIKAFCDKLKQQRSRTVKMFELAMEERDTFSFAELLMLCENPVTKAITQNLVFIVVCENIDKFISGFIVKNGIQSASGDILPLDDDTLLRVAHPYDLYVNGVWSDYQKRIMELGSSESRKQPFRQVFRELYVKLPEEADKTRSLMFAGNQVQPKKTVATLRSRRWIADYEDGLQKVYYKDDIIADIYAVADWFSPSDVEAPTLEGVIFSSRKTYNVLKISEIPDIIYSEVMRDVDLAVSVAHAGGVDPETSHSTIEMRRVIVEFNMELFGIKNVTIDKNHAVIEGKRGKYTVHLGSGVIHKMGSRQINVVAVSSGKKSKLFLPFVDEDPKTAEIVTKILTFAQDDKIKDPFIMEQIMN